MKKVKASKSKDAANLYRELVHKGKNRNKNRLVNLKARVLEPRRAKTAADLENILVSWCEDIETIEDDLTDEHGKRQGQLSLDDTFGRQSY